MFEETLKNLANNYFESINSLIDLHQEIKPKIIKRKFYVRKKRRYKKVIIVNYFHDIIENSIAINNIALRILKYNMNNKAQ